MAALVGAAMRVFSRVAGNQYPRGKAPLGFPEPVKLLSPPRRMISYFLIGYVGQNA